MEFLHCHCEEVDRTTRQSIVSRMTRTGLEVRSLVHSGSPHTGTDDDKGEGVSGGEIKK